MALSFSDPAGNVSALYAACYKRQPGRAHRASGAMAFTTPYYPFRLRSLPVEISGRGPCKPAIAAGALCRVLVAQISPARRPAVATPVWYGPRCRVHGETRYRPAGAAGFSRWDGLPGLSSNLARVSPEADSFIAGLVVGCARRPTISGSGGPGRGCRRLYYQWK